jgi:hypothetical protein
MNFEKLKFDSVKFDSVKFDSVFDKMCVKFEIA